MLRKRPGKTFGYFIIGLLAITTFSCSTVKTTAFSPVEDQSNPAVKTVSDPSETERDDGRNETDVLTCQPKCSHTESHVKCVISQDAEALFKRFGYPFSMGTSTWNCYQACGIPFLQQEITEKKEAAPSETASDVPPPPRQDAAFYEEYSDILGIKLDGTENKELLMAVEEWLQTPYRWGGCSKNGIDCSCLVKAIYEDVYGIRLTRTSKSLFRQITPVSKEDLREGDILCFRIRGRRVSHVGIYLKDNKFVHASRSKGVTIADLNKKYFKRRLVTGGRVAGRDGMRLSALSAFSGLWQ